jgi:hypothetical protein
MSEGWTPSAASIWAEQLSGEVLADRSEPLSDEVLAGRLERASMATVTRFEQDMLMLEAADRLRRTARLQPPR